VNDPVFSRRRVLAGATVGGLALPLLSACGGGTSPGSAGGPAAAGGQKQNGPDRLVATSDVPVGGGVILASQDVVVTQPTKGTFEGFSATCTHEGCILASVASGTINCGCHGSQFSITDGKNVAGPNGEPAGSVAALPRRSVKVKGPDVVLT
jgi:nitrite reductase/ring-hydroxylating ferredoxin subunit